jgi:hypothetical protein
MAQTKPLWRRFVEMTPEELEAENADARARANAGTMTAAEIDERREAHEKAQQWTAQRAEQMTRLIRLANATGCPKDVPIVPWLIGKGLLVKTEDGYAFTDEAMRLPLTAISPDDG